MDKSGSRLYVLAIIFFTAFAIMCYKGYDKMINYNNSSFSYENAYVGGDAYNYIINGTHATAFFVLAVGFLISGILCLIGGFIVNRLTFSLTNDDHYKLNLINESQRESLVTQKNILKLLTYLVKNHLSIKNKIILHYYCKHLV